MTKDEALKMAIEALEMHVPYYIKDRGCKAIQACKEALEQPEPRMFLDLSNSNGNHPIEQPAFDYNTAFSHGYEAHRVEQKLEQPAYETESWKNNMKEAEKILAKAKFANEQPAQEPVAIVTGHIEISLLSDTINKMLPINTELYTHPAPSSYQSNSKLSYSEELAYQAGFEAGRSFERGCDD